MTAAVKSTVTGAASTVTNQLTDEKTYDKKINFEALFERTLLVLH